MAKVIRASWDDFRRIVDSARERLLVCVPYYSEEGLGQLFDVFHLEAELSFVSRLSPSDWLGGVSDPEALLVLFELLQKQDRSHRFTIHQQVHAKAYLADRAIGLVGSANLSAGGFDRNFELMVELDTNEAEIADRLIEKEIHDQGRSLCPEALRRWVETHQDQITKLRRKKAKKRILRKFSEIWMSY